MIFNEGLQQAREKLSANRQRFLDMLVEAHPAWMTNWDIIIQRFTRFSDIFFKIDPILREHGWTWEKRLKSGRTWEYRLKRLNIEKTGQITFPALYEDTPERCEDCAGGTLWGDAEVYEDKAI